MKKKGQISVFLIIGVLVVIALLILFFYLSSTGKINIGTLAQSSKFAAELQPVGSFVETCVKSSAEQGLITIGLQGWLYKRGDQCFAERDSCYNTGLGYLIPYYYFPDASSYYPSKKTVEGELAQYVTDSLSLCLNDFSSFKELGFQVEAGSPTTTVSITPGKVQVIVQMDMNLQVGAVKESEVKKFVERLDVDVDHVYKAAERVYEAHKADPNAVPLSDLANIGLEEGYYFELLYASQEDVIYGLLFPNVTIKDSPYILAFGGAYSWPDLNVATVEGPKVGQIEPQVAKVGQYYTFELPLLGSGNFKCDVLSPGFLEESDCTLAFNPTASLVNERGWPVMLQVTDENGGSTIVTFPLTVVSDAQKGAPRFTSTLEFTVDAGPVSLEVNADADGRTVAYTLPSNPSNLHVEGNRIVGTVSGNSGDVLTYQIAAYTIEDVQFVQDTLVIRIK